MSNKGVPASTIMTNAAVTPAASMFFTKSSPGFIDHAVEEFRYNHILRTTRHFPCPAFGRATEETGWQKFASPNMAVTIDNLHFLLATMSISRKSRCTASSSQQGVYDGRYTQ